MANINQHMGPVQTQYMQTYVDQHVPMPFEFLQKKLDQKQADYDTQAQNLDGIIKLMGVQYRPEVKDQYFNTVKRERDEIEKMVESVNGDITQISPWIRQKASEIKQRKEAGDLAIFQQQHDAWKDEVLKFHEEGVKKGIDKGGFSQEGAEAAKAIESKMFQESVAKDGVGYIRPTFKASSEYDWITKIGNEQISKMKTWTEDNWKQYYKDNPELEGYIHAKGTSKEELTGARIKQAVEFALKNNPEFQRDMAFRSQYMGEDWANKYTQSIFDTNEAVYSVYNKKKQENLYKDLDYAPGGGSLKEQNKAVVVTSTMEANQLYDNKSGKSNLPNRLGNLLIATKAKSPGNVPLDPDEATKYSTAYFDGLVHNGETYVPRKVNYNGKVVEMTSLPEYTRYKLISDGKVPLPASLNDEQKKFLMSQAHQEFARLKQVEDRKIEYTQNAVNDLPNRTDRDIYNNLEKNFGGLAKELGFQNVADFLVAQKALNDYSRSVDTKQGVAEAMPSNAAKFNDLYKDPKNRNAFDKLSQITSRYKDVADKVAEGVDERLKQTMETHQIHYSTLPIIDSETIGYNNDGSPRFKDNSALVKNTHNSLTNFINTPLAYSISGNNTFDGTKTSIEDISYVPKLENGETKFVKGKDAITLNYGRPGKGEQQVFASGFDKDGNQITIRIPNSQLQALQLNVPGMRNLLETKDYESRASNIIRDTKTNISSDTDLSTEISTMIPIVVSTRNVDDPRSRETFTKNGFVVTHTDPDGVRHNLNMSEAELKKVIAKALYAESIINDSNTDWKEAIEIKKQIKENLLEQIKPYYVNDNPIQVGK